MMWMLGEGEKAFYDKNDPCAGLELPVDNIDNFDDILAEELLRYNEDGDGDEQEGHFCMATEDGPDNVLFDDLFGTI